MHESLFSMHVADALINIHPEACSVLPTRLYLKINQNAYDIIVIACTCTTFFVYCILHVVDY